jgi:hypothetical protein
MSALTSLLVRDQAVPIRKIEEALQRQVVFGSELSSVLLELDALPENTLAAYCAALYGLPPATRDEVMGAPGEAIAAVPRAIAEKYRLIPLALEGSTLLVAMAHPLSPDIAAQLERALGLKLATRIVCDVRISAALVHHYGAEVSAQHRRLIERLRERAAGPVPHVQAPRTGQVDPRTLSELPAPRPSVAAFLDEDEDEDEDARDAETADAENARDAETATAENGIARAAPDREDRGTQPHLRAPEVPTLPRMPSARALEPHPAAPPRLASEPPPSPHRPSAHPKSTISTQPIIGVGGSPSRPPPPCPAPACPAPASPTPARPAPTSPARASPPAPRQDRESAPSEARLAPRRLRGPLTAASAKKLLDEAVERDDIVHVFFAFARQFFEYAALFVVHDEVADGRDAFGSGASADAVRRMTIALDRPGLFADVKRTLASRVGTLAHTASDRAVAAALLRDARIPALVLPVVIRSRAVLLLYGDRGGEHFEVVDLPELVAFVPRVVDAIERLILRRKRAAGAGDDRGRGSVADRERLTEPARHPAVSVTSRKAGSPRPIALPASDPPPPPSVDRAAPAGAFAPPAPFASAPTARVLAPVTPIATPASDETSSADIAATDPDPDSAPSATSIDVRAIARAASAQPQTIRSMLGIPRDAPPPPDSQISLPPASDPPPAPARTPALCSPFTPRAASEDGDS